MTVPATSASHADILQAISLPPPLRVALAAPPQWVLRSVSDGGGLDHWSTSATITFSGGHVVASAPEVKVVQLQLSGFVPA
jgi:hypothetical protein